MESKEDSYKNFQTAWPWASDKRMSECVLYHVGGVFYKTDSEDKRILVHKHCLQELRKREEKKDE